MAGHCPSCGAPLAPDQRYCLECGTRSPILGSAMADDLGALLSTMQPGAAPDATGQPALAPAAEPPRAGNTTAVIAGVGVLLLSMGVGVLIGRASSPASKAPAAPAEVISVSSTGASSGTGAGQTSTPTSTTPASTTPSSTTPNSTKSAPKHASKGSSSSESSSGAGQGPSKPAPPTVLEHLQGGKGSTYEQKSKNLPNVISTG